MKPVALLIAQDTVYGRVYHPANKVAVQLAGISGTRNIPEDRLPYIIALGFEIAQTNGQPIAHPGAKAYERKQEAKPVHILDNA